MNESVSPLPLMLIVYYHAESHPNLKAIYGLPGDDGRADEKILHGGRRRDWRGRLFTECKRSRAASPADLSIICLSAHSESRFGL